MIDPRHLDFAAWSSQTALLISGYGTVPIARDEKDWQGWAAQVINFSQFGGINAPLPQRFPDWRSWAFAFNLSVGLTLGI